MASGLVRLGDVMPILGGSNVLNPFPHRFWKGEIGHIVLDIEKVLVSTKNNEVSHFPHHLNLQRRLFSQYASSYVTTKFRAQRNLNHLDRLLYEEEDELHLHLIGSRWLDWPAD